MVVKVDRGEAVKINNINFTGNEVFSNNKLRKKLKKTKKKFLLRFWKKSKYIIKEFEGDKQNLIEFYKEKGYRDARIVTDSILNEDEKTMSLQIDLQEGNRYYFGDISYLGNSVYTNNQLNQILGIKSGDPYNGVLLKERIQDDNPDANDLANLYQNSGYLFSNINAVEVSAENDLSLIHI